MIVLSPAAANEIRRLRIACDAPDSLLRLKVQGGGCADFYYILEWSDRPQDSDRHYESQGIEIIIDSESDRYLDNLKLDYSQDLMGGGFRFHNPNAVKTCSCGISFAIEENNP